MTNLIPKIFHINRSNDNVNIPRNVEKERDICVGEVRAVTDEALALIVQSEEILHKDIYSKKFREEFLQLVGTHWPLWQLF